MEFTPDTDELSLTPSKEPADAVCQACRHSCEEARVVEKGGLAGKGVPREHSRQATWGGRKSSGQAPCFMGSDGLRRPPTETPFPAGLRRRRGPEHAIAKVFSQIVDAHWNEQVLAN